MVNKLAGNVIFTYETFLCAHDYKDSRTLFCGTSTTFVLLCLYHTFSVTHMTEVTGLQLWRVLEIPTIIDTFVKDYPRRNFP